MEVFSYVLGKKAGGGGSGEPTGTINVTSNGTKNVKSYAYANVNVQPKLEAKTVTIEENGTTTITPTSGKDGLSSVQITTNVSDRDWTEIGYEAEPVSIQEGFNYAKQIYDNWDATQTNCGSMFVNNIDLLYFPNVDTSNVAIMGSMFKNCYVIEVGDIDFSSSTNCSYMFQNARNLKEVGNVNVPNGCTMTGMFSGCSTLEKIGSIHITSSMNNPTDLVNLFGTCTNLQTIGSITTNLKKVGGTYCIYMFSGCDSFTNETWNKVLGFFKELTEQEENKKTLKFFGLYEEDVAKCVTLPNWQDLVNAGWTTGY